MIRTKLYRYTKIDGFKFLLDCTTPKCPANAICRTQSGGATASEYPNGTLIIYTCNKGYELDGYPSIQCLDDGLWTATPPQCIAKQRACNGSNPPACCDGAMATCFSAAIIVVFALCHMLFRGE